MTESEILDVIREAARTADPERSARYDSLVPECTFEELGLDSVVTLNMISDVEARTRVTISNDDLLHLRTVGNLIDLVRRAEDVR